MFKSFANKTWQKLRANNMLGLFLGLSLLVGITTHSVNMFSYPYFESDEGTYMSQAWSVLQEGELAPYTYWYDHAPAGWLQIAALSQFTGGLYAFGNTLFTGRFLMLLFNIANIIMVFHLARKLTGKPIYGFLAVLVFTLSPIAIYFHRRILLDNIMVFWLLLSTTLLHRPKVTLLNVVGSGAAFAIAILTKLSAVMFGPAMLYLLFAKHISTNRRYTVWLWLFVAGLVYSLYIIYALVKSEFFPSGWFSDAEHVSLISSLMLQMGRGSEVGVFNPASDFMASLRDWITKDVILVVLMFVTLITSAVIAVKERAMRFYVVAAALYSYFLLRGGIVINFYIVPLLPLVAIMFAGVIKRVVESIDRKYLAKVLPGAIAGAMIVIYLLVVPTRQYTADETSAQMEAISWMKDNLPADSAIIIDAYALTDLRDERFHNDKTFPNADWFYKVSRDTEIRDDKYNADWRNFDYIAVTHELLKQIRNGQDPILREAFVNSFPVKRFTSNSIAFIDEQEFRSTNGDWAMIYQVNNNNREQLLQSWNYYKENFIHSYGQVIDPQTGATTSEGQSYAMLRSVWMNDQVTFDGVWDWTWHHFQWREPDRLLSWKWEGDRVTDGSNATDADQDVALALLFAYKNWGEPRYLTAAQELIDNIWDHTVIDIRGRYYLLPMNTVEAERWNGYLFNPSYLSPAHYRIFAEVDDDPSHDWLQLAADSYATLDDLVALPGNRTNMVSDWYLLNQQTHSFRSASEHFPGSSDHSGFDAFRIMWRVAVDEAWFDTPEATEYLQSVAPFVSRQFERRGNLPSVYGINGNVIERQPSLSTDAGYLFALLAADDPELVQEFYQERFTQMLSDDGRYWNDGQNYYEQNWAWFGSALFNRDLPNLWEFFDDPKVAIGE